MYTNIRQFLTHIIDDELSYTLTRPHPYTKTFKRWILAGSFVVLALLTVVNLATNGFDKQPLYSPDPNKTVTELHWYNSKIFTWGDDTLEPKCQNVDLPIGHQFLTSNLGLQYTVQKIIGPDNQPRASVSYHANTLKSCELSNVGISLRNSGFAKPATDGSYKWEPWIQSTADAVVRCNITIDEGDFTLELKTDYKTYIEQFTYIAVGEPQGQAPFWWGARLMNAYFVGTQYVMSGPLPDDNNDTAVFTAARLSYEIEPGSTPRSIKDPLLFRAWMYFLRGDTGVRETMEKDGLTTDTLYNNASYSKSRPLTEGMFFAKVFRSLILADLGMGNSQTENLLLSPELLQYALNPGTDDFNRVDGAPLALNKNNSDWWKFGGIAPPHEYPTEKVAVPFAEAYAQFKDRTGELETKPATINAVYTCAVPGKKSTTAMFLFTLVADLALFQTAWGLFKHVLDQRTTWKDERANYCEGCVKGYGVVAMCDGENSPALPMKSPSIGGSSEKPLLGGEENT